MGLRLLKMLMRQAPSIILPEEVIYGAQYTASGYGAAANAFDGNLATNWFPYVADNTKTWVGKRYVSPRLFNKATVHFKGVHYIYSYAIEYSNDGINWTVAGIKNGLYLKVGIDSVSFPAIQALYWRYRTVTASDLKNKELAEVIFEYI